MMVIDMNDAKLTTLTQIKEFLDGTEEVTFRMEPNERYEFIERTLGRLGYAMHGRGDKGVLLRYIERMTRLSRQQVTRLVKRYLDKGVLKKRNGAPKCGFKRTFTAEDIALLAEMDALHGTLSGPATKKLMARAATLFGDGRYERLADISISHLYNLRERTDYQNRRMHWTKTRPNGVPIGQRRAPQPNGSPGYVRIDSVHQGDQDGQKGVYHINAVDCVTQFQIVATCERISEAFLLPVLEDLLAGFPFVIIGFHSDNGSEYVNHTVARLLEKLRIEFTKSRPRQSNDNALAESKNASVVRKHLGYAHIPQHLAGAVNAFCRDFLNPYINFHRPCFFPEIIIDSKGKERKRYKYEDMMTPYEKLKSLQKNPDQYLKPGVTSDKLDALAKAISDNDAAAALNKARQALFRSISKQGRKVA